MIHILSHYKSIIVKIVSMYICSKILQPCCVWNVLNMLVKSEVLVLRYQFLPSHSICIPSVYEFAMVIKYMLSYDDGAGPDFNYAPMLQVSLCFRVHNSGICMYQSRIKAQSCMKRSK